MGKNKPIVVIGLMGSGKTTAGRLIAEALGMPFSDSDTYLRENYGGPSAEIAARDGREVLHEREAEHVIRELAGEPKVIAAAASTVEDAGAREAMRAATVLWLDADDEVLTQRMSTSSHRPGYSPSSLRARREPFFREVADFTYDVGLLKPEDVLAAVLRDIDLPASGDG